MAGAGRKLDQLTVVALGDPADLVGAKGRASPEWRREWREARSRQPHRLTFIRVIALPPDYLSASAP